MKILKEHFEYNNGTYSLVELENYQCIEKWEQNGRQVEIKPKENEENKVTSIWLVIYQAGTLLINGPSFLTQKEFDAIFKDFENIQVDIERTFLFAQKYNMVLPRNYSITPFYKDGARSACIDFSKDDFDSLRELINSFKKQV
ncbi:TPA: hypothetical protein ACQWG9_001482 [Neisseria subflava]|jgi:hypothetical protein|uniref:hypothetical protein n=1 Tax=unclassified Neisseria TaxID=2623750 RepID=UPI0035FC944C